MESCPKCNAEIIDGFEVCWKCGSHFNPTEYLAESVANDEESQNKVKNINCLRCNTPMKDRGQISFHEGTRYGVLGDLAEFLVNKEVFKYYTCPGCGKVEFFI